MKKPVLFYKNLVTIFLLGMMNFLIFPENVSAQGTCTPGSFTTIGNTSVLPTNELQLTPDLQYQKGGIWSNNKATLSQPFDFTVNVFLGDKNNTGADGLCFVLHNSPEGLSAIGQDGRGIGACDGDNGDGGIKPSFTIEIDTWQNANLGWTDPADDHLAAHINGDGRHTNPSNTIMSPVTIANIEDNAYHAFRVTWNPTTQLIQIYLDGTLKASTNYDLIGYFEGTAVYWGYTASTGDSRNEHKVCPQGTLDATILADDDVYLNADGVTGGTLGNALTNDKLNFVAATTANVSLSVLDPDPSGKVSLNTSTGDITLATGTPDGVYTVRYQICETASPSNCAYAYIKVDTRNPTQISITPENAWLQQTINRCWTATVLDASNVPVAGITVDFTVSGSPTVPGGSAVTDANGQAEFCYTGPLKSPGFYTHVITATVHGTGIYTATNANWYIWSLGSVTLSPLTGTSEINVENAWTALVKDGGCVCGGQNVPPSPLPEQTVSFYFWFGPNSGISVPNSTTNSDGIAYFYLTGTNTGYDYFYTQCSKPGYGTKYSDNAGFTWTAPVVTYPLSYDANGGTGNVPVDANSPYEAAETVTVLGNVGAPTPLSKAGHIFSGWNTQANGLGTTYQAAATFSMPASAVTLYALWTPAYPLTYDANGGTGNVPVDGSSPYAAAATVTVLGNVGTPTVLSKTGYIFSGWNTQADGNGTTYQAAATFSMPAGAMTLYAKWLPISTITFDTHGGNLIDPITQVEGTSVTAPPDPTKAGFTFTGWVPAVPANMPDDDLTCHAQWEEIKYQVTYDANGGTGSVPVDASSPYSVGASATVLGNIGVPPLEKQYHTFGGWNTLANGSGTPYAAGSTLTMTANDVVLYAIWTADTYTVTYDANTGTGNVPVDGNSPYVVGAPVTVLGNVGTPNPLTKTDHTFGGWNTLANGTGTTYQAGGTLTMTANDVVLYALWNPNSNAVTYDANGGTGNVPVDGSSPYTPGSSVTVLGNIMNPPVTKQYHTFGGWNTQANGQGTTYQAGNSFNMPSSAVILYALWVPDTYTVTYDANGGTGNAPVDGNNPYAVGVSVTVLSNVGTPAMAKQYHTFGGWNTQANGGGTTYQTGGSFNMPANNVVLYALWTADTYTVTYDANGGTGNAPLDGSSPFEVGASVTVLGNTGTPALTKQYHTFGGWNTQANGGGTTYQAGNSFNMPSSAVILYALWVPDTYTVTYDANGGTGNVPVDGNSPYEVGESVTVLGNVGTPVLTKQYHTFGGWNTQADGNGTPYQAGNQFNMPANNIILFAIWTADTYTVTYDANTGTGNVPVDGSSPYEVGASVTVLGNTGTPALTKLYHSFGGWNTESDGSGTTYQASNSFNMPDQNVVLYALWTADTYTVTYDANGGTGNTPVDGSSPYIVGASVTVLGNAGIPELTKPYYSLDGWNTQADGNGAPYQPGNQFDMPAANVTLYAVWTCTQIKDVLVSIRASKMPGNQVKFKAYPINGGDAPYYKWYRADGSGTTLVAEGLNLDEYVTTCKGGDEHWVELISSLPCTGNNATAASDPLCTF